MKRIKILIKIITVLIMIFSINMVFIGDAANLSNTGTNSKFISTGISGSAEIVKHTDNGVLPVQLVPEDNTNPDNTAKYEIVAKTAELSLYVDMEKGWFALKDLKSGKFWYSRPNDFSLDTITKGEKRQESKSDVLIDYLFANEEASTQNLLTANSHTECVRNKTVTVTKINNGVKVEYDFESLGILIPVEYTLTDSYLNARIDSKGILEYVAYKNYKIQHGAVQDSLKNIKECVLVNINLLPMFGAGKAKDDGYLFIPDGSGALINLNNQISYQGDYEKTVYGDDLSIIKNSSKTNSETVRIPVFGIVKNGEALSGIIEKGDGAASLKVIDTGDTCNYGSISSKYNYRLATISTLYKDDFVNKRDIMRVARVINNLSSYDVRYYSLTGESADYVGMAKNYRKYLENEKGMKAVVNGPTLNLNLYGAADIDATFLGFPYKKIISLTTFKQASDIVKTLENEGVERLSVRYSGWSNFGMLNNKAVKDAIPLSILGGEKEFTSLANYINSKNISFYPDVDFLQYRKSGNGISKYGDSIHTAFGEVSYQYQYMQSVFIISKIMPTLLLTPQKIKFISDRFLDSYKKLPVKGIGLSALGSKFYSNLDSKNGFYRSGTDEVFRTVLQTYKQSGYDILTDGGNSYVIPYVDKIYSTPIYSSGQDLFATDVPFYQIVFHGYVSMTGPSNVKGFQNKVTFLKAVETGNELLYDGMSADSALLSDTRYNGLYSTTFDLWKDDAVTRYKEYYDILEKIYKSPIIGHQQLVNGVYMTTYENGIRIIVNYSDKTYADPESSKTVDSMDFISIEKKV